MINQIDLDAIQYNFRWKETTIRKRFWEKVDIKSDDECWEWMGSKNQKGRGLLGIHGTTISVPRISWLIHFNDIPDGLFVCHHCDNPSCVNPKHLFLGTNSDNIQDMWDKKRRIPYSGEEIKNSKLTNEQARKIRESYYPRTNKRRKELSEMFDVSDQIIQRIVYGKTYKDA